MKELTNEQIEYAVGSLSRVIESRKITQTQLEQWSSVNQSTISKILSRTQDTSAEFYRPSEELLRKLFQALGLKLGDVLNESDRLTEEITGYLATPLTGIANQASDKQLRRVVSLIRQIASEKQFDSPPFEIYWPGDHTHPLQHPDISAPQVYVTDRSRASTHDFIILFCADKSFGVGQENEIATQAGVPAIRLVPEKGLSRMMLGSFVLATDITYRGALDSNIHFSQDELRAALATVRRAYFRHRALYKGINGDAFGKRLRKLIDERSGDYERFAEDLGISLRYLHNLMDEPFAVSNPSARLLKRMALSLGERVSYLIGESEESDPIGVDSHATWRSWVDRSGVQGSLAFSLRDKWRHNYSAMRREHQSTASFRRSVPKMTEADWEKDYQQSQKDGRRTTPGANQDLF